MQLLLTYTIYFYNYCIVSVGSFVHTNPKVTKNGGLEEYNTIYFGLGFMVAIVL